MMIAGTVSVLSHHDLSGADVFEYRAEVRWLQPATADGELREFGDADAVNAVVALSASVTTNRQKYPIWYYIYDKRVEVETVPQPLGHEHRNFAQGFGRRPSGGEFYGYGGNDPGVVACELGNAIWRHDWQTAEELDRVGPLVANDLDQVAGAFHSTSSAGQPNETTSATLFCLAGGAEPRELWAVRRDNAPRTTIVAVKNIGYSILVVEQTAELTGQRDCSVLELSRTTGAIQREDRLRTSDGARFLADDVATLRDAFVFAGKSGVSGAECQLMFLDRTTGRRSELDLEGFDWIGGVAANRTGIFVTGGAIAPDAAGNPQPINPQFRHYSLDRNLLAECTWGDAEYQPLEARLLVGIETFVCGKALLGPDKNPGYYVTRLISRGQ